MHADRCDSMRAWLASSLLLLTVLGLAVVAEPASAALPCDTTCYQDFRACQGSVDAFCTTPQGLCVVYVARLGDCLP